MAYQGDILTDGHSFAFARGAGEEDSLLADTLATLAEQITVAFDCTECCIYDYLPDTRSLWARAIWSKHLTPRDTRWVGELHELAEIPDFQDVVERCEVTVSYPEDAVDASTSGFESMSYWGELAAIWAPISHGDEVLGFLELTEKERPRAFGEQDKELARRMASLAALALRNARLTRTAEQRNRQLTALIDASRAITSTLDLDEVLDAVCRQTAHALNASAGYIFEYDAETDTQRWLADYRSDLGDEHGGSVGTKHRPCDLPQEMAVIRTRQPAQARREDPAVSPMVRRRLLHRGEQATLMVPLLFGDAVVGTLEVSEATRPRRFTDEEVALCAALGEQAAVAIHNAQMYRQLQEQKAIIERQAISDELTGLANRRELWERLRDEVARTARYGQPLSLLMLDLDDFKSVNDRYGHLAGDAVLRAIGGILRDHVRQGVDLAARCGGEEFAVILPSTTSAGDPASPNGALATAERIRRAVAGLQASVGHGDWTGVTVSIGVATLPTHATNAEELVSRADEALYRSKRLGKDRVAAFEPE